LIVYRPSTIIYSTLSIYERGGRVGKAKMIEAVLSVISALITAAKAIVKFFGFIAEIRPTPA
jgi:hypothetical protein